MISSTPSARWLIYSASSNLLDSLSCIFHFSYCILQLWLVLFNIICLFMFLLHSSTLCSSPVSIFVRITLKSFSGRLLIFILLGSFFGGGLSYSFVWNIFPRLLVLSVCVYMYYVGQQCLLVHNRVNLCRKCPLGCSSWVPSGHQQQVLQGCFLCMLHTFSYCDWAVLVGRVGSQPSCHQWSAATTVRTLVQGWPQAWLAERSGYTYCGHASGRS